MNDGYRNLPAINEAGVFGTPATILPIDAVAEFPVLSGAEAGAAATPARSSTSSPSPGPTGSRAART